MTQYLSDKLKVVSLVSIFVVLYIHSYFPADQIAGMTAMETTQFAITELIGRLAVPMFYVISGYLFFLKVPDGMKSIFEKMRKRVRSLLVPYVIASFVFLGTLSAVELIPFTAKYYHGNTLALFNEPIGQILQTVFWGDGAPKPMPYGFHLWFLRNLIVVVATAPIWYFCLRKFGWWFIAGCFVMTFFDYAQIAFSLFWFCLGGKLVGSTLFEGENDSKSCSNTTQLFNNKQITGGGEQLLAGCAFVTLSVAQLLMPDAIPWKVVRTPIIVLGLIGAWRLYDIVAGKSFKLADHSRLATACSLTFFIYLFHLPALRIFSQTIVAIIGKTTVGYLVAFLASPVLLAPCIMFVGLRLKKYCGTVYKVVMGGR